MKYLISGDWHFTTRPLDNYRWDIIPWTCKQIEQRGIDRLFILGDLTAAKDNHGAELVNRVCDGLLTLAKYCPVHVLMGNHDYAEESNPFFRFVSRMASAKHPIDFFTSPSAMKHEGEPEIALLPHTKRWRSWVKTDVWKHVCKCDLVLMHQTVSGAIGDTGRRLGGMPFKILDKIKPSAHVVSGDIHTPQQVGRVTYAGSPYPINYGDDYKPRVLLWQDGKLKSLPRASIRKAMVHVPDVKALAKSDLHEGDMLRVVLHLPRSEYVHWDEHVADVRQACETRGLILGGVKVKAAEGSKPDAASVESAVPATSAASPHDLLARYCRTRKTPKPLRKLAATLLDDALVNVPPSLLAGGVRVRFLNLAVQGFRSFGDDQVFSFPRKPGFYFLTGKNELHPELGRNATGKSSLWAALTWVLFGKTDRGQKAGDVHHWGDEHLTTVLLELEINGKQYAIARSWNPNSLTLETLDKSKREPKAISQEQLEALLGGLSLDTFMNAVLLGQFGDWFFDLSSTAMLQTFGDAMGLALWERFGETVRKHGKAHATAVTAITMQLERARGQRDGLKVALEQALDRQAKQAKYDDEHREELTTEHKTLTDQLTAYEADKAAKASGIAAAKVTISDLEQQLIKSDDYIKDVQKERNAIGRQMAAMVVERTHAKKAVTAFQGNPECPACGQPLSKATWEAKLAKARKSLKDVRGQITVLEAKDKGLEAVELKAKQHYEDVTKKLNAAEAKLQSLQAPLTAKKPDTHHIGFLWSSIDSLDRAKAAHAKDVKAARFKVKEARDEVNKLKAELAETQRKGAATEYWDQQAKEMRLWLVSESLLEFEVAVNNVLPDLGLDGWRVKFDVEKETKSGTVSKGFTVTVVPPHGKPAPFTSFSGGETQRLRVAGAMGLSDLVRGRRGLDVELEVWDEPTAGLSRRGVDDLLEAMQARAQQAKRQTWLVDHRTLDHGGFDAVTTVALTEAGSEVRQ